MGSRKTVSIGDLGRIVGGATPSTKIRENWDGDIPWLRILRITISATSQEESAISHNKDMKAALLKYCLRELFFSARELQLVISLLLKTPFAQIKVLNQLSQMMK